MKNQIFAAILVFGLISCSAPGADVQPLHTDIPPATNTLSSPSTTPTPTLPPTSTPLLPQQLEYYHLRFVYTVTSDWGTLEFLSPEAFAWTQLVEVTGNPQTAILGVNRLDVYRPLGEIADNPTATIIFDAILLAEQASNPLEVSSSHGAMNGSGLMIFLVDSSGQEILLDEINHYWVDAGNPDTSLTRFAIQSERLTATAPLRAVVQRADVERLVWAIYYPWYMPHFAPRWWSSDIWTDRPIDPYSSDDVEGLRAHIAAAQAAGIDGFLVEWCGVQSRDDGGVIDANFGKMLDLAAEMNFKLAAYYDLLCTQGLDPADLDYLLTERATHPAYYHMDGLPVVVMYNTESIAPDAWLGILEQAGSEGLQAVLVGESYDPARFALFEGLHQYVNFGIPDLQAAYNTLDSHVLFGPIFQPDRRTHFWAATVTPGFDNTPIFNGRDALNQGMQPEDILLLDRAGGQTYRDSWELALQSEADWIIITSWNEWQENTHIEPSQMYGDEYLQLTKSYIAQWKSP